MSAAGDVRFFDPPDEKEAARWVVKRFGESGISCSPAVARRLVELAGEEIGDLALEVEKVAAYCGGEEPDVEMVDLLVVGEMDIKPWDVTDAWGRRDAGRVIELATAGIERPDDVHRTLAQIANHVRRVRRALLLMERAADQTEVAEAAGDEAVPGQEAVRAGTAVQRGRAGGRRRPSGAAGRGGQGRQPARPAARARAGAGRDQRGMSAQTAAAAIAALVSLARTAVVASAADPSRRAGAAAGVADRLRAVLGCGLALWYGAANGWTSAAFRLYYLAGGILVVPYLAVGELLLIAPGRRFTRLAVATMLWVTFASTAAVIAADVDAAELASAGATPPNDAMGGPWTTILAAVLNSIGTVILLGGSIASARRRRDPRPLLVAAGVIVIALTASATRLDSYALFAAGQATGIVLIMLGLVLRR